MPNKALNIAPVIFSFLLFAGCSTDHQEVDQLASESLQLLKAKKYEEAIELLLHPDHLAEIAAKNNISLSEIVIEFSTSNKPAQLEKKIELALQQKPVVNEDCTELFFQFDRKYLSELGAKPLKFKKIDGRWWLLN